MNTRPRRYADLLLFPQHEDLLAASGIAPDVATERGYKSVDKKAALKRLGFSESQCNPPALLLPTYSVATGERALFQIRPDMPRVNSAGRPIKYETPHRARMVIDCHPRMRSLLGDPTKPLFITEGIRKADAAVSHGLCCIALLGVWNWRGTNEHGGQTALPEWEYIALNDRPVYIVFDSDVMVNPDVHAALIRLKAFLESRGAKVALIYLPPGEGGTKVGLDDYLGTGHKVEDLLALATTEARAPALSRETMSASAWEPKLPAIVASLNVVDGRVLVRSLEAFLTKYIVLPHGAPLVLSLWILATWLAEQFDAFPYLAITSPERRCAKTRLLELLLLTTRDALPAANISEPAFYRTIEKLHPTLLIDEAQHLRKRDEKSAMMHDLLCAGFRRPTAFVYRMSGPNRDELAKFSVYCPKAIALIGQMTDVLMDRSIEVPMQRRKRTESIERHFFTRTAVEVAPLCGQILRWTTDHRTEIAGAYLTLAPSLWGLEDREAELWMPLFVVLLIADPNRIEELEEIAAGSRTAKEKTDTSLGVRLLRDIRKAFGEAEFIPTKNLLESLVKIEDAPWSVCERGKPLTARGLAKRLIRFGIEPDRRDQVRGYWREDFAEAWERYDPPSEHNPTGGPRDRVPIPTQPHPDKVHSYPSEASAPNTDAGIRNFLYPSATPRLTDAESVKNLHPERPLTLLTDKRALDGGYAVNGPPSGPCPQCTSRFFWQNQQDVVACVSCTPPVDYRDVKRRITLQKSPWDPNGPWVARET